MYSPSRVNHQNGVPHSKNQSGLRVVSKGGDLVGGRRPCTFGTLKRCTERHFCERQAPVDVNQRKDRGTRPNVLTAPHTSPEGKSAAVEANSVSRPRSWCTVLPFCVFIFRRVPSAANFVLFDIDDGVAHQIKVQLHRSLKMQQKLPSVTRFSQISTRAGHTLQAM
jgi:hypothetical protein